MHTSPKASGNLAYDANQQSTSLLKFKKLALALSLCFAGAANASSIHQEVLDALAVAEAEATRGEVAKVEVYVNLKNDKPLTSGEAEELARYASDIQKLQNTLIQETSLASRSAEVETFSHLPIVSMKADRQTIEELASHPDVETITFVNVDYPTMSQARNIGDVNHVINTLNHRGSNITVAVLDTGIRASHSHFTSDNAVVAQACFVGATCGASPNVANDVHGHGTHVSGIITGNNGTAPNAKIAAVKVLSDSGSSVGSSVVQGLNWVIANHAEHNIRVVNMSLGGGRYYSQSDCDWARSSERTAFQTLRTAGVLSVVSSGNDAWTDSLGGPGCVTEALAVGSVGDASFNLTFGNCTDNGQADKMTCFTNAHFVSSLNHRDSMLDILAPGCRITAATNESNSSTGDKCGTSMAAPFVAGVAAGIFGREPSASADAVRDLLINRATLRPDYRTPTMSYPRVNARASHEGLESQFRPKNDSVESGSRIVVSTYPSSYSEDLMAYGTTYTDASNNSSDPRGDQFCGRDPRHTLWWELTPTARARIQVSTTGEGNITNTVLGNYRFLTSGWDLQGCNDDHSSTYFSQNTFIADGSSTYFTVVGHYSVLPKGQKGKLGVRFDRAISPANDLIESAAIVTSGSASNYSSAQGATESANDPVFSCRSDGAGKGYQTMWYSYTPPSNGILTATATPSGVEYSDSMIAMYSGSVTLSNEVACNDIPESGNAARSLISNQRVTAGTTYYFQVASKTELSVPTSASLNFLLNFTAQPTQGATLPTSLEQATGLNRTGSYSLALRNSSPATDLTWTLHATAPSASCSSPTTLPWVTPASTSGTLAYSTSPTTMAINYNSSTLGAGSHQAKLCLGTNDPLAAMTEIPVTLHVRAVNVTPTTLGDVTVGTPVNLSLAGSGANTSAPYSFSIASGTLPTGLTLAPTGEITGTPTQRGSYDFTVAAVDSSAAGINGPYTGSQSYTMQSLGSIASVSPIAPTNIAIDGARTLTTAINNTGNATLELSVNTTTSGCEAPSWLTVSLDSASVAAGENTLVHLNIDAEGLSVGQHLATLCLNTNDPELPFYASNVVANVLAIDLSPSNLPNAVTEANYSHALEAVAHSAFSGPFSYSLIGSAPDGLSLSSEGELTGTAGTPGAYPFAVRVTDSTPTAEGGPFTGEHEYAFQIDTIEMFEDGFENPMGGRIQLNHYGKATLAMNVVDTLSRADVITTTHLYDLMMQDRRIGIVEARCENTVCSIRVTTRNAHGQRDVGQWITVDNDPMVIELDLGTLTRLN